MRHIATFGRRSLSWYKMYMRAFLLPKNVLYWARVWDDKHWPKDALFAGSEGIQLVIEHALTTVTSYIILLWRETSIDQNYRANMAKL